MSSAKFHVFLSHNSADKPAVEELARRLKAEGIEGWLDKWHLIPGEPWQPALEQALADSESVAVFVGPSGLGPWQNEEMRAAISRRVGQSEGRFRVIPVLLPGGIRDNRSTLPTFLVASTWVEFRRSLDEQDAYHRLKCGILGQMPGTAPGEAIYEGQCPYRGLQAFQPEHAQFFFGREARIEWLLNMLRPATASGSGEVSKENRFLGIIGASGSGKSSLAGAGLVPALRHGRLEGSADWPIVICRPGQNPLEGLAVSLAADPAIGSRIGDVGDLIARMEADETRLHLATRVALGTAAESQRVVVLVDQFEEVFTLQSDAMKSIRSSRSFSDITKLDPSAARRKAFIDNLVYAAGIPGGKTIVVLTMRADFYGKCAAYGHLAAALSDHQDLVGPMTTTELREVIERPAQLVGLELENGLTEILLRDMENQPGALPLLQHALWELWQRREGRRLTIAAYQNIGGLEGALEKQANEVFEGLSPSDKETCRRVFLRLTQPGEGSEDTKRRVALSQVGDSAATASVIQRLANVRLITTEGQGNKSSEGFVEVAHEALIRNWSKLRSWVDADREALRTQHRLTESSFEWDESKRDPGFLYQGARLAEAEEWSKSPEADLTPLEREFLAASLEQRDRGKREEEQRKARELETLKQLADSESQRARDSAAAELRSKWFTRAALTLATLAIAAFFWAVKAQRDAVQNSKLAEEARSQIEETLASDLLDRIHLAPDSFGPNEFQGYWQVAELPPEHERLRTLVLSIGLKNPDFSVRLANRAPQVAQALVGLNAERRETLVKQLLMPVLKDEASPHAAKLAAVRLGIALKMDGAEFAGQSVRTLSQGLVQSSDSRTADALAADLKTAVQLFAAGDLSPAVGPIVEAMNQTRDVRLLRRFCEALALIPQISKDDRRAVADRLLKELEQQPHPDVIRELIRCQQAFPKQQHFVDAERVVGSVVRAIENTGNPDVQNSLADAMESIVDRLQPADCPLASDKFQRAMKDAEDSQSVLVFARCLNAVAIELSETDLARGTKMILSGMEITAEADPLRELANGLGRLKGKLAESDARTAIARLLKVMEETTTTHALRVLAESLAQIPAKLTDEDTARATERLLSQLHEDSLPPDLFELAKGLAALPGTLSTENGLTVVRMILGRLDRTNKTEIISAIKAALEPIGAKLTSETAEAAAKLVMESMKSSGDSLKLLALSHGVRGMQAVLSGATIQNAYQIVLSKMHDEELALPMDLSILAESLAVLPGDTPESVANDAIQKLLDRLGETTNPIAVQYLVAGLGSVGGTISTDVGHRTVDQILKTIKNTHETKLWRVLALGLASLSIELDHAGKFTPSDAANVVTQLAWAMDVTTDPADLKRLAEALAAVATKLPSDGAQEAAQTAIQQVLKSVEVARDPDVIGTLAEGWRALAGRMSPQQTQDAFSRIEIAVEDPGNFAVRPSLCRAAVSLATSTAQGRAREPLGHLLNLLHNDHDPEVLKILLDGIEKSAHMLPPANVNHVIPKLMAITGEQDRMNDQILNGVYKSLDALPGEIPLPELVEWLKSPFCTGDARQTLLAMIESQTKLKLNGNPWKLVASAKEARLDPKVFQQPVHRPQIVKMFDTQSEPSANP